MKLLRKSLIAAHRYLGLALGLLIIVWFVSGFVMMYAGGMPRMTPQTRLDRMPELDLARVEVTPAEAFDLAGGRGRVQLLTIMDRPAYSVGGRIVFADTGGLLGEITLEEARTVASRFMDLPEDRIEHAATLHGTDQWMLGIGQQYPLYKFQVDDPDLTQVYVQPRTGEVVQMTTRRGRALAWVGTIPHWLYFIALRSNQPLWYDIVVWTSAAACVLALLGLMLAVVQFKRTRPFRLSRSIPYVGLTRWHYITGAIFGVFTLTWAFSGLISMEPFAWTLARGLETEVRPDVFTGGEVDLAQFTAFEPAAWSQVLGGRGIKEMDFTRIQDAHYYVVRQAPEGDGFSRRERLHEPYDVARGRAEPDRVLVAADSLEIRQEPFSAESLVTRLGAAVPDVPILESELLTEYDSYYYSRGGQAPLPVLRVKFDDPAETWFYVDPEMSQMLVVVHRFSRLERWLFNGLHSFDFGFWYNSRAWDVGMIVLLLGGLTTTCLGMVMGVRRMRRGAARAAKPRRVDVPASPQPSATVLSRAVPPPGPPKL